MHWMLSVTQLVSNFTDFFVIKYVQDSEIISPYKTRSFNKLIPFSNIYYTDITGAVWKQRNQGWATNKLKGTSLEGYQPSQAVLPWDNHHISHQAVWGHIPHGATVRPYQPSWSPCAWPTAPVLWGSYAHHSPPSVIFQPESNFSCSGSSATSVCRQHTILTQLCNHWDVREAYYFLQRGKIYILGS